MQDLQLSMSESRIAGKGRDVVGSFTMDGCRRPDGLVEILKQYRGAHSVLYVGNYDGEGTLYGTWDISGYRGQWSIRILHPQGDQDQEIVDILPPL